MNGSQQQKICDSEKQINPASSVSAEGVLRAREQIAEKPLFQAVHDSVDAYVMILNSQRQILAINQQMRNDFQIDADADFLGLHPGEAIGCLHSEEGMAGCGSSAACLLCGAADAISECQQRGHCVEKECGITIRRGSFTESMEFLVRATPVSADALDLIVVVFQNTSTPRRREILDRAFYHDVLNTVGGLLGWSKMLQQYEEADPRQIAGRIWSLANRLCNEIQDQRRLTQAEKGDLVVCLEKVPIGQIFEDLKASFIAYDDAEGRILDIEDVDPEEKIVTDTSLLLRILVNMMKNAMEASESGDTIRIWHEWREGSPVFLVQNPGIIPSDIAQQIFCRSFTTKGSQGRGIGTFSMKLFGEKYLKGKVGFLSNWEEGTIFYVELPAWEFSEEIDSEDCEEIGPF